MSTQILEQTMKAATVKQKGGAFELIQKNIPSPGPGQVRVQVKACGICHSDVLTKEGPLAWDSISTFSRP